MAQISNIDNKHNAKSMANRPPADPPQELPATCPISSRNLPDISQVEPRCRERGRGVAEMLALAVGFGLCVGEIVSWREFRRML